MDTRKIQFLKAVIGEDGGQALAKAAAQSADLEWAILPRVIMAWLEVVGEGQYQDHLPGVQGTNLSFKKSESGFVGSIDIGDDVYTFVDASLNHVAGSVAVALGADPRAPELRSPQFAKLGKAIDVLVKSRTLRKIAAKVHGGAKGAATPGAAAAPRPPMGAAPPTAVQPQNTGKNGTLGSKVQLPGVKPKKQTMKVTKAEADAQCGVCRLKNFSGGKYAGCLCFTALAKSVRTVAVEGGYVLEFGSAWDADAIVTLAEALGK